MYSCGMVDYQLTPEELADLRAAHRRARDVRAAYRINAVILPGRGRTVADATHPLHNPVIGCGWIKRGEEHPIKSNTGRRRFNVNGAIDIVTMNAQVRFDDTVDADSTVALVEKIERAYPTAKRMTVICDNARYYRAKAVAAYLKSSRIQLRFLPAYSPNLNLIKQFWKFFKRQVLYNRYYEEFEQFKGACRSFFADLASHEPALRTPLTEKFEIVLN